MKVRLAREHAMHPVPVYANKWEDDPNNIGNERVAEQATLQQICDIWQTKLRRGFAAMVQGH